MTSRRTQGETRQAGGSARRLAVVAVCLLLLALFAVAQVAHSHAIGDDADHCPLCILLQTAVPVLAAVVLPVLVPVRRKIVFVEAPAVVRPWSPKLFTRPPPSCR